MKRLLLCLNVLFLAVPATGQQYKQGGLVVDASQFGQSDICLDIQAAIATLPTNATAGATFGAVIDARNFVPPAGASFLTCTVNPFAIFGVSTNPAILVSNGYTPSMASPPTPGSSGGVLLLPGATIAVNVPWLVPQNWSIIGESAGLTQLAPSSSFPAPGTGTLTLTSKSSTLITGSTNFTGDLIGSILMACPSASCTAASYQNATIVGIVTNQPATTTTLNLGSNAQAVCSGSSTCPYSFIEPVLAWATTNQCTVSGSTMCVGALSNTTIGSLIQDIDIDCSLNGALGTIVANCIPFWDEYGQERSQLKRDRITSFNILGIGIYTANAQNGGPFEDLQMSFGTNTGTASFAGGACVEAGGNGVGGTPPMRGIRGLSCLNANGTSSSNPSGTGVDINTRNFTLSDAHFENLSDGVNIGPLGSATGIHVDDITGGGSSATYATATVVNIASYCATCSTPTADIHLVNIYQPFTSKGPALSDAISGTGHTTTEATLGLYNLGDGSGLGTSSTRPVLTTSSSIGSSPNLVLMTAGQPITGVQGNGTWVQMSGAGYTFASGHLLQADGNNNTQDSGVSATNPTFTGTATVGTLSATTISGTPNFSGTPTFSNTVALNTTGTSGGLTGTPNVTVGSITGSSINQPSASAFGGTCTMVASSSCAAVTIGHTYSAPVCVCSEQASSGTFYACRCSVSGATVSVSASGSNSSTFGFLVFGNPN